MVINSATGIQTNNLKIKRKSANWSVNAEYAKDRAQDI